MDSTYSDAFRLPVPIHSVLLGATEILAPDNPRAAVTRSCRYKPDLNVTYRKLTEHYGTVIIPAGVGKPKHKDQGSYCTSFLYIRNILG